MCVCCCVYRFKIEGSASKYCNKKYDNAASLHPLNKFQQIGNAVSPRLARATGECLLMALLHGTPRHAVVKWQADPNPSDPVWNAFPACLPACLPVCFFLPKNAY